MSRIVRRVFVGGALIAALAVVSPAEAAGRGRWAGNAPGLLEQAWHWVVNLLGGAPPEPRQDKFGGGIDPNGGSGSKRGGGIDPDGSPTSPEGSAASSCAECERGMGIDPDG